MNLELYTLYEKYQNAQLGIHIDPILDEIDQFLNQDFSRSSRFILDELAEVIAREDLERTDALLGIVQMLFPIEPDHEEELGVKIQQLLDVLIVRGAEDFVRGWLIHRIVDIYYHIEHLITIIRDRDQRNLFQSIARLVDVDYADLEDNHQCELRVETEWPFQSSLSSLSQLDWESM